MGAQASGVTNEASIGLPPLAEHRRDVYDYYRIAFLDDGFPGRRDGDVVQPHPIYGTYAIVDYVQQYERSKDPRLLAAAGRVLDAALTRMETCGDGLVFRYDPSTGISAIPHAFVSGLTQARYVQALDRLFASSGDPAHREAAEAALRGMRVAVADGGATRQTPSGGAVIEEYAYDLPDYTLNGWTTASLIVGEHAEAVDSDDARDYFRRSIDGLKDVLELYDLPELANSRYRLAGLARIRLTFSSRGARVAGGDLEVPGHGVRSIAAAGVLGENRFVRGLSVAGDVEDRTAVAEVHLSRASWPAANRLRVTVEAPRRTKVSVAIGTGPYNPVTSQLPVKEFVTVLETTVDAGSREVALDLPWDAAPLVAYPTTFGKVIGGRRYNQYHFIHVDTLTRLAPHDDDGVLADVAQRWRAYPERWPELADYRDADVELTQHVVRRPARAARGPS